MANLAVAAAAAAAAIGGTLAAAVGKAVKDVSQLGTEVSKSAQEVGLSTKSYQELAHAMHMATGDGEGLKDALLPLSEAMRDAAEGAEAKKNAFDRLGISVRDSNGWLRDVDDILPELANKFANTADGADKVALAQELMGDAGSRLIPLLNQGAQGLDAMRAEASSLGQVLADETIKQAQQFDAALKRASASAEGLKNVLGAALLPVANALTEAFTGIAGSLFETVQAEDTVRSATQFLTGALLDIVDAIDTFAPVLAGVISGMRAWGNAVTIVINTFQIFPQLIGGVATVIGEFVSGALADFLSDAGTLANLLGADGLGGSLLSAAKGFQDFEKTAASASDVLFESIAGDVDDIATDFEDLGDTISDLSDGVISDKLRGALDVIRGKLKDVGKTTTDVAKEMGGGFKKMGDDAAAAADRIVAAFEEAQSAISSAMAAASGNAARVAEGDVPAFRPTDTNAMPGAAPGQGRGPGLSFNADVFSDAAAGITALTGGADMLLSAFTELWQSTEGFQKILAGVTEVFESVFEPVMEDIMGKFAKVLAPILDMLDALSPLLNVVLTFMQPFAIALEGAALAVEALAKPIRAFVRAVKRAVNGIRIAIANIGRRKSRKAYLDEDGNIVDPKGKIGDRPQREIEPAQRSGHVREEPETQAAFTTLGSVVRRTSQDLGVFGEEARKATESLTNVPIIFRANLRRAQASGGTSRAGAGTGQGLFGEGLGTLANARPGEIGFAMFDNVIQVLANDPEEFTRALERQNYVRTGNPARGLNTGGMVFTET